MKHRAEKNIFRALALLLMMLLLSGCMMMDTSDLLTLPELSPDHSQLIQLISAETSSGWTSANPVSGENRLTLQFIDFYGDGIAEAVTFYRNAKELKLCLAVYSKTGETSYAEMCRIETTGTQFNRVDFADVNNDGALEIIIGLQYGSTAIYALNAYAIRNNLPSQILDTNCTAYAVYDLDGDGVDDIISVSNDETGANAYAELFSLDEAAPSGALVSRGRANVSSGVKQTDFITCGRLNDSMRCAVAEGRISDATTATYISDVLVYTEASGFYNLSYAPFYGMSYETQRTVPLYFSDVDFSGNLEFPIAVPMPMPASVSAAAESYIQWYNYDASGNVSAGKAAYFSLADGWYFIYPSAWVDQVYTVTVELSGYTATSFCTEYDGRQYELLTVCVCGEGRPETEAGKSLVAVGENRGKTVCALISKAVSGTPEAVSKLYITGLTELLQRFAGISSSGAYLKLQG